MTSLPFATPALWHSLESHAARIVATDPRALYAAATQRPPVVTAAGLTLDLQRQRLDQAALADLLAMAGAASLPARIRECLAGADVNASEARPALHTALRDPSTAPLEVHGTDIRPTIRAERERVRRFVAAVRSGARRGATGLPFTDVVSIGIGGSDLGPVMGLAALKPYAKGGPRVHFVANVDGTEWSDLAPSLAPATTLVIVCSKTFTTQETLANAELARDWLRAALGADAVPAHFAAVSVNQSAMDRFGVASDARFPLWDWVGGRYSMWSAIGVGIELAIGSEAFDALLAGAHAMDSHFAAAPLAANVPVLLGLVGVWNRNLLGCASHVVLPYSQRLHRLPAYLQQLEMESNGKSVRRDGSPVHWPTVPVIWGEPGSNAQHSFLQMLHQGAGGVSIDVITLEAPAHGPASGQSLALANALGQVRALTDGYTLAEASEELRERGLDAAAVARLAPHKVHAGGRPVSQLRLVDLSPASLGALLAAYEHKVFVQSVLWDVNPFDQWGVELGKRLATLALAAR